MKVKLIYIFSNIQNSLGFEWLGKYLDRSRYDLKFVFLNPGTGILQQHLADMGVEVITIPFHGKKDLPAAIWKLYRLFKTEKPDIIHAHLFEASIAALIAGRLAGVKNRYYTRHHAYFHHSDHPQAVKYDKLCNRLATKIIAVSNAVSKVLVDLEDAPSEKIQVVHHGFELEKFKTEYIGGERIQQLKAKYNPSGKSPVVGVISRYISWKGLQYIIPAFKDVLKKYPDAFLILANARGSYKSRVTELLSELPAGSYTEIEFENDIFALYHLFDIFIHTPIREDAEAFGQIYVETMAAGIPIVGTMAGIAPDLLVHRKNAWVVPFHDRDAITEGILNVLGDEKLRTDLVRNGYLSVKDEFTVESMIKRLENVYKG